MKRLVALSLASLLAASVLPIAMLAWYRSPQSPVFIASVSDIDDFIQAYLSQKAKTTAE